MAISQSVLINKSYSYSDRSAVMESLLKSADSKRTAFLCHSHSDENLVKGLIVVFKEAGLDLYVDWKDHSMPDKPNGETARKIQERIRESNIFIFLATANSKASRWCPWEIGYADSSKKGIYIIPTTDGYNTYGNEYLELYPKIDAGRYQTDNKPGYFVTQPEETAGYAISNERLK